MTEKIITQIKQKRSQVESDLEDNSDDAEEGRVEEPHIQFYNDTDESASSASFWELVSCEWIENIS